MADRLLYPRQRLARHERSAIIKRSVVIGGHKTSVTLEDAFWTGLKQIARSRNMTLSDIVGDIDRGRHRGNLSSAIRLFVFSWTRAGAFAGAATAQRAANDLSC